MRENSHQGPVVVVRKGWVKVRITEMVLTIDVV